MKYDVVAHEHAQFQRPVEVSPSSEPFDGVPANVDIRRRSDAGRDGALGAAMLADALDEMLPVDGRIEAARTEQPGDEHPEGQGHEPLAVRDVVRPEEPAEPESAGDMPSGPPDEPPEGPPPPGGGGEPDPEPGDDGQGDSSGGQYVPEMLPEVAPDAAADASEPASETIPEAPTDGAGPPSDAVEPVAEVTPTTEVAAPEAPAPRRSAPVTLWPRGKVLVGIVEAATVLARHGTSLAEAVQDYPDLRDRVDVLANGALTDDKAAEQLEVSRQYVSLLRAKLLTRVVVEASPDIRDELPTPDSLRGGNANTAGQQLRRMLEREGYTIAAAARAIGAHPTTLSKFLAGESHPPASAYVDPLLDLTRQSPVFSTYIRTLYVAERTELTQIATMLRRGHQEVISPTELRGSTADVLTLLQGRLAQQGLTLEDIIPEEQASLRRTAQEWVSGEGVVSQFGRPLSRSRSIQIERRLLNAAMRAVRELPLEQSAALIPSLDTETNAGWDIGNLARLVDMGPADIAEQAGVSERTVVNFFRGHLYLQRPIVKAILDALAAHIGPEEVQAQYLEYCLEYAYHTARMGSDEAG